MTKSELFIFALGVILVPFEPTKCDGPPCVLCNFAELSSDFPHPFSIPDLPERCDAVSYGAYFFDSPPTEEDKNLVASLISANKKVYGLTSFYDKTIRIKILNSNDLNSFNEQLGPLETFLKDSKLNGIILDKLGLFDGDIPDYATKLNAFICKIKADVPTLIVGILVNGDDCDSYRKKDLFDFTIANAQVDIYVIDTFSPGAVPCFPKKPKIAPIDKICQSVSASGMDQTKLWINLKIYPNMLDTASDWPQIFISYAEYCDRTGTNSSEVWCADSVQTVYDEATQAKSYFKGLMLSYVNLDDSVGTCGCGKFPVTNAFIDGWQSKPLTPCDKIC